MMLILKVINALKIKKYEIKNLFIKIETLATELSRTALIFNQINSFFEKTNLSLPERLKNDEKLDYQLIEEYFSFFCNFIK